MVITTIMVVSPVQAQFGMGGGTENVAEKKQIPEDLLQQQLKQRTQQQLGINVDGSQQQKGILSDQDAADMQAIIDEAKKDEKTMEMVSRLKNEMSGELDGLRKLGMDEVLGGMKEAVDNMKMIEYLFKDKERAVTEMDKEGMIDPKHLKEYKLNPDLLEEDTRRGLYFQFISLSVVGGYL